jgi:tryptophan synthase beta chain
VAPTMKKSQVLVVNLSGRGDKDVHIAAKMWGITL